MKITKSITIDIEIESDEMSPGNSSIYYEKIDDYIEDISREVMFIFADPDTKIIYTDYDKVDIIDTSHRIYINKQSH